jgi:hypothetical protein
MEEGDLSLNVKSGLTMSVDPQDGYLGVVVLCIDRVAVE